MSVASQGFLIRPCTAGDEQRFLEMFRDLVASGPEPCAPEAPAHVWCCVMSPEGPMRMLIAESAGGRPVGFALWVTFPYSWSARPVAYLLDVLVEQEMRRLGIGTALIEAVGAIGKREGWMKLFWMTQADNLEARAVYNRIAERSPLVRYDMFLNPH